MLALTVDGPLGGLQSPERAAGRWKRSSRRASLRTDFTLEATQCRLRPWGLAEGQERGGRGMGCVLPSVAPSVPPGEAAAPHTHPHPTPAEFIWTGASETVAQASRLFQA